MCCILFGKLCAFTACFYFTCCPVSAGVKGQRVLGKAIKKVGLQSRPGRTTHLLFRSSARWHELFIWAFRHPRSRFNQIKTWCIVEKSWTTRKRLLGFNLMYFLRGQWKCGTIQTSGRSFQPHTMCLICCCSGLRNTQMYSKVTAKYCQSLLRNLWSYNFTDRFQ